LVALAQRDARRLIAYLSVSQLGLCALGIFAVGRLAVCGGALHAINHGLSASGLLAVAGMLQMRYRTRDIDRLGGFARQAPRLASLTLVLILAAVGLPGLNGFASQLLVFWGMFQHGWASQYRMIWMLAAAGVLITAGYMLCISWRMFFGAPRSTQTDVEPAAVDLSVREACALAPLLLLIVWIGLQPKFFLDRMEPDLGRLTEAARTRAAEEQPGDCPDFSAGKMGLSPSQTSKEN